MLLKTAKKAAIIENSEYKLPLYAEFVQGGFPMSNRIFQSVVLQMKEGTDRVIGVIDAEGAVVACDELSLVGERWAGVVEQINTAESGMLQ